MMPPPADTTTPAGPGARLRAAREAAGVSRHELATRLGLSYPLVSDIEVDRKALTLETIHKVATAIGCDPHSIDPRLAPSRGRARKA